MTVSEPSAFARDLLTFLDASPSPFHVVAEAAERLEAAGFREIDETEGWREVSGRRFLRRGGTLIAWHAPASHSAPARLRIVGAHTDSPNLRLKPNPDSGSHGFRQLGVEVYGGALYNSWLDRDLGVSGRLVVRDESGPRPMLVRSDDLAMRVPQLAIHLDREANKGLTLNAQTHLRPVWGLDSAGRHEFLAVLAERHDVDVSSIMGHDLMLHDLTPARFLGASDEFIASARIDNLASCHAGLHAIVEAEPADGAVSVLCLFDHEEIGSMSASGADGAVLATVVHRILSRLGHDSDERAAALARSACLSADGAHATHPNYADRHDPHHHISLDGGPVLKSNANVRYATDAHSSAEFILACESAEVPYQRFAMRSDLACGSTIGPITAARLGISTVDAGIAQLSMHSAREMCGSHDPERFSRVLAGFLGA